MATKVITGKVRASFVHIFEPQSVNGSDPRYSCSFIIPKSDTETIGKIREAVEQARQDGVTKWGGKIPPNLKLPLRDGDIDRPDDPNYAGAWFINANSNERPGVVDRRRVPITDPLEVYSGCYVRASITFYPFNTNGNRGIACGLQNIQKWCDGEPLNGRVRAEDEFDALDDVDDEDFLKQRRASVGSPVRGYWISCSRSSNMGLSKNSRRLMSRPSHTCLIVTMPGFLLFALSIL